MRQGLAGYSIFLQAELLAVGETTTLIDDGLGIAIVTKLPDGRLLWKLPPMPGLDELKQHYRATEALP
jgi:hypothetical protein